MAESLWQRVRTWWQGTSTPVSMSPNQVEEVMGSRTAYQRAIDRLGDLADLGCERGLSAREQAEYIRLDHAVKAYEAMSPAHTEREAIWAALSTEEQQARDREAYESRGSDPRVEAAQEQLFAQQREEGEWIGWHEPISAPETEHPAWFLTPYREGNSVVYEMSEAVYDEWRLASSAEQPGIEQTIKAVVERDNGPGEYAVITPHGDTAFSFTVQDVHQQEQQAAAEWAHAMNDPQAYHNLSTAEQQAYEDRPYDALEDRAHGMQPDYPTQYAGSMGSAPDRIEIDTSDAEMGQRWQDQLAALDARLEALVQGQDPHRQHQQHGLRY
jgi:hypothetical protein